MSTTGGSGRGSSEYAGFILKNQQFLSYCREIICFSHRQPWLSLSFLNPSMKSSYIGLSYSFHFLTKSTTVHVHIPRLRGISRLCLIAYRN